MKISLPLKLGITVIVIFTLTLAACLLWTPLRVRYYASKLKSDDPKERVEAIDFLIRKSRMENTEFAAACSIDVDEADLIVTCKDSNNKLVPYGEGLMPPLAIAAENGFRVATMYFLEKGADVEAGGYGKISPADGSHTSIAAMKYISGKKPMQLAVMKGHKEIIGMLLEKGADINCISSYYRKTPLYLAIETNHREIATYLIHNGAEVNKTGNEKWNNETPLICAVKKRYIELVRLLLENGAYVDARDNDGKTGLHIACEKRKLKLAKLLIERGAGINSRDGMNNTPLHYAVKNSALEFVRLLIDSGADVNTDSESNAPLAWAVMGGDERIVELFLSKDADVNIKFHDTTPLHMATQYEFLRIVKYLLNAGAGVNEKDLHNRTPLDIALIQNSSSIAYLLRAHGAKTGEEIRKQENKETSK